MAMTQHSLLSLGPTGFHRIAYTDWGARDASHIAICVHGLSRNSRDFDFLARALQSSCRVVCMDVVGRGESEWLADSSAYNFDTYTADAAALIARVTAPRGESWLQALQRRFGRAKPGAQRLDWVGTSMGGLIGLLLAAKRGSPIRRLVLNDVGPLVPWQGLLRLGGHMAPAKPFATREEAEAHLREACSHFGLDSEAQWEHVLVNGIEEIPDGFALRYDPALAAPRRSPDPGLPMGLNFARGIDLWHVWDAIDCPVLVLRGARSDVLLPDTVERMRSRSNVRVVEFADVGHAPALMNAEQTAVVRDFLMEP